MNIFRSPKNVFLNTDITLECKVTDFGSPVLDLSNVGVQWLYGSQRKEIYSSKAGAAASKRSGAKISTTELQKGDASLYLPNIQLSEAGEYTCVVLVTPDKVEKSSRVVILAKPKVLLSTQHITILNGTEKSVWCDATEFYPQNHEIFWEKVIRGKAERLERHVCTGAAVSNNDGTFNVSSNIRIVPTLNDDGNIYKCTMRHQSLPDELSQEVKLTVEVSEPESTSTAAVVISALLGGFGLLFAAGLPAYLWIFLKVAPKVTGCSEHQVLKHLEEKVVTWMVNSFRPREVTVVIYAKRKQEDKHQLLKWSDKDWNENCSQHVSTNGQDYNVMGILMQPDVEDASFKPQISEFTTNTLKISSVEVSVRIYPDISQDDGAELSIEVQHRALKEPITRTLTLDVIGVPPKVLNILKPRLIKDKEPAALSCSISGFKPRPLNIIWQQKRKNADLEELVQMQLDNTTTMHDNKMNLKGNHYISEVEHEDKTYSIASVLVIVPDIQQDQSSQYFCSILHHSTNDKQEKAITLSITASPKLGTIKCDVAKPIAKEPVNLSCQISSFFPRDITVKWLKDGSEIQQNSVVNKAETGQDELYQLTANVKIVLTIADARTKYTCQVIHESLSKPKETHWVAGEVISLPKILEIKADPPSPEIGKSLTLSCTAYEFYPEGNQIFWFKDFSKVQNPSKVGIVTEASKEDSSGLYSRSSQWTFTPTTADHGKEFKMQFLHSETSSKPVTSSYRLQLRAPPKLGTIKCNTAKPIAKEPVNLSCQISSFFPRDITVKWLKDGSEIQQNSVVNKAETGQDELYQLTANVKIVLTIADARTKYTCQVTHESLSKPKETHWVAGEVISLPKILEIKADPPSPEIGKSLTLSCTAYEFYPEGNQIFWFKDFSKVQNPSKVGIVTEASKEDSSGLYSRSSQWTFTPTTADHGKEFKMQFLHSETSSKPVTSSYRLQLRAPPKLGTIKCNTAKPIAKEPVNLSCQISSFFPRDITVKWLKDGSDIQQNSVVNKAETGQDELYQLTANVKIVLTIADARTKYTCQVTHESLSKPKETHWVAGEVISLPKILEIKADPPSPEIGKSLTLSCTAYEFYPEGNQIFWFKDFSKVQNPSKVGIVTEASKEDSSGLYSRSSQWTFTPTTADHGKEFKMQFLHSETSSKPVTSSYRLQLRAPPKLGTIKCNTAKPIAKEPVNLSCQISSFFPRDITVKWLKDGSEIQQNSVVNKAETGQDELYQLTANVKIVLTIADARTKYTCQVTHESLSKPKETHWVAGEVISLPKILEIKADPPSPEIGKSLTLSCTAYEFYPEGNQIFWFKDFSKVQNPSKVGIVTEASKEDSSGLYSRSSQWTFTPTTADHGKEFKMQFLHSETSSKPVTSSYRLQLRDNAVKKDDNNTATCKDNAVKEDDS
ncbi:uncharacterized protein LOC132397552 [Hypanus sabinus]|uniref:uncharacterized protein LOC132397552 n=1 Tax=Hypanus sabinus TaxID=79690 RepID=UPI0028C3C792|nr:uncharacterized protein LOC132397552 [Hypanus sabinus]